MKFSKAILVGLALLLLVVPACTCKEIDGKIILNDDCFGDVIPCANATYDIGSPILWWDNLYAINCFCQNVSYNATGNCTEIVAATLVVAASDSLDPSRADYQCDGVADDVEINAALVALPAMGGSVVLLEGNYACAANIIVPVAGMLRGQGTSTILTWNGLAVTQGIELDNHSRVKELSAIIGPGCGTAGKRPNIIYVDNKIGVYIQYVNLYGDTTVGDDGNVNRQNGILFASDVDGSNILSCNIANNQYFGIRLALGSEYNGIEGNMIYDSLDGIFVHGSDGNNLVANACQSNAERGIHLNDAHANNVESNMIRVNTGSGIYCLASDENVFTGNNSRDNDKHGIQFDGGDYNTITGNSFTDNDYGGNTYSGISLNGADWTTITGNQCTGNGLSGIYLSRANYCTITGNECNDQFTGDGIHIFGDGTDNADYNTVIGNVCYDNADDGLELFGGTDCNYTIVDGNQLRGNTGTNYVDGGNQTQYWGGSTESLIELRPAIDYTNVAAHGGTPTNVLVNTTANATTRGFSMPIWNNAANVDEELYFYVCVPQRWDGESDIEIHIDCCIAQAENNKNFQLELAWEYWTPGDIVPGTSNIMEVEQATGAGAAAFQSYQLQFIIDYDIHVGDPMIADDLLTFRLRSEAAASGNDIAGEIIVIHPGLIFQRDKVGEPVP